MTDDEIIELAKQSTGWTVHFAVPSEPNGHFYAGPHHQGSVNSILRFARALLSTAKPAVADQSADDVRADGYRRGIEDAFHRINMINANRRGRTGDETCSYIVRTLAEWVNIFDQDCATAAPSLSTEAGRGKVELTESAPRLVGYGECQCILSQYCDGTCRPIFEKATNPTGGES